MHVGMCDLYEERGRIRVRPPAVRYAQKSKQTNMHTRVSVYVCVYEERERISFTLITTAAQGRASDLCMCSRARACWYYFANLSTVYACLPARRDTNTHTHTQAILKTQSNTRQVIIEKQHLHSSNVSQYSATRKTHTHPSDESPAKMSVCRADN
jgi:hypothetical protein